MPETPDFHKIAATITDSDIQDFYRSAAPEDFKQQVREAPDEETKKRFVAGYLIRTRQITPERLNPKAKKTATRKKTVTKTAEAKKTTSTKKNT
jgi:hypothetical protein